MAKIGTKKQITVEGIDYTLQFPGHREATRIQDRIQTEGGGASNEKYMEELFKNVIVDPPVSWEYFDEHEGFDEVIKEASTFLRTGK